MASSRLLNLAKQALSIVSTATAKDNEINMWIDSAIADMERAGINARDNTDNGLIESAIIMYVRGNYGSTDPKEKELSMMSYKLHVGELALSDEYRKV